MKNLFVLGVILLGLFATSVQAGTRRCHTILDCQVLKGEVERDVAELLKQIVLPELTDILKVGVNHFEAEKICQDLGLRLPTAREFALLSKSLGAVGISETEKAGSFLVKGASIADQFHFNQKDYKRPPDGLGQMWFWSSSTQHDSSRYAYVFLGYSGSFEILLRSDSNRYASAVRCVSSR